MINHHIDRAISLLDFHQNYIELYEDIFEWGEEDNLKVEFSEDETEYNQNILKKERMGEDFLNYCRKELKYHKHELNRAKVRLNVCMLTFNKGWVFE